MTSSIPADDYARQTKQLTAAANRLRGWVGSDESKTPEFADALVALAAHRLRGHALAEAASESQEGLALAAKLVASHGPLGPYTPVDDAKRLVVAAVQVAFVQTEAGHSDGAAQTLATAEGLMATLAGHGLRLDLDAETNALALIVTSRVGLADGDAARANAAIDAVPSGDGLIELDRLGALAAARWAAGLPGDAVAAAWQAVETYDRQSTDLLSAAPRLAPARLARACQPMSGLYADLADRLSASGDIEAGLATRRTLVERLAAVAGLRGTLGAAELAASRRALAEDLARVGRDAEADELLAMPGVRRAPARLVLEPADERIGWQPLAHGAPFVASSGSDFDGLAAAAARAEAARAEAATLERERAIAAEQARQRQAADDARAAAERERAAEERARAERAAAQREAAERVDAEQAAIAESQRQRAERLALHEQEQRRREAELREAAEQATDGLVAARATLAAARAAGDKQAAYGAAQDVVVELRGRFTADAAVAGELIEALQDLATAQRQAGDWWGSRRPAKEAKELARTWAR